MKKDKTKAMTGRTGAHIAMVCHRINIPMVKDNKHPMYLNICIDINPMSLQHFRRSENIQFEGNHDIGPSML